MHPLQLDVIDRACVLWSNPHETVLTPFMGVGSEVYGAVVNSRRGIGVELKASYYRQAVRNLADAATKASQGDERTLFDELPDGPVDIRKHCEWGGAAVPKEQIVTD